LTANTLKPAARWRQAWPIVAIVAITALGLFLRLWQLGAQSLWYDEAQTLYVARFPLAEIVRRTYRPPLYHFLLHFWAPIGGESEFALRLPSALFGALVPPLAYLVARRFYGRRVGLIAAALAALSPTLVYYAQEMRMYSLMAFEFLLLLYLFSRLVLDDKPSPLWLWASLLVVEVAALYTHYFALPFLGWLAFLGLIILWAGRRRRRLCGWLAAQALAAVSYIPWLLVILSGQGGTSDYTDASPLPTVSQVPGARDAILQSWDFYTSSALGVHTPLLQALSLAAAAALGVGVIILLVGAVRALVQWLTLHPPLIPPAGGTVGGSLYDALLLALIGAPFLVAIVMYQLRPGVVAPRHLMMIAGPWIVLIARIGDLAFSAAWAGRARLMGALGRLAGTAALIACVGLFALGLDIAYTDPAHQRPDVRALARHVEEMTHAGDIVLFDYTDYAFDYYFHGPAQIWRLETRVGDEALANWFTALVPQARRAVLLRWVDVYADPRDFTPWLLQVNGRLVGFDWEAQHSLSIYDFPAPLAMPAFTPTQVRYGPLQLQGQYWPAAVSQDQALPVGLQWQAAAQPPADYKDSLRVLDEGGNLITADDRVLLSEQTMATSSHWQAGATTHSYHLLSLPVGTPPLTYTLSLSVYHEAKGTLPLEAKGAAGAEALDVLNDAGAAMGQSHTLGTFQVQRPAQFPEHFPSTISMTRVGKEAAPGLSLEGFNLDKATLQAGEALGVTLHWKATSAPLPDYQPELRLVDASGAVLASQQGRPAYGRYACSQWIQGELVTDRRSLTVNPNAASGEARLELEVPGGEPLVLQTVQVQKADRTFELPPVQHPLDVTLGGAARLRGFDLDSTTVKAGQPLRLTLYWQAVGDQPPATGYTVFTHLLGADNQVVAQHDGQPANGEWPTSRWVKQQIVIDPHDLTWKDSSYQGEATLEVGMYDPATFQRLATAEGEDRVLLPIKVTVEP